MQKTTACISACLGHNMREPGKMRYALRKAIVALLSVLVILGGCGKQETDQTAKREGTQDSERVATDTRQKATKHDPKVDLCTFLAAFVKGKVANYEGYTVTGSGENLYGFEKNRGTVLWICPFCIEADGSLKALHSFGDYVRAQIDGKSTLPNPLGYE